mgnify:CR=1 FL=1
MYVNWERETKSSWTLTQLQIIVPGLSPKFKKGNAFFKPFKIVLTHNEPIYTLVFFV